jgi:hypothetical protein
MSEQDAWMKYIDALERIAFNLPAPNSHTPMIVQTCIELRNVLRQHASPKREAGAVITLPMTDYEVFLRALDADTKPTQALIDLMRNYDAAKATQPLPDAGAVNATIKNISDEYFANEYGGVHEAIDELDRILRKHLASPPPGYAVVPVEGRGE